MASEGDRRYMCPDNECRKTFIKLDSLRRHVRNKRHDPCGQVVAARGPSFLCPIAHCGFAAHTAQLLAQHGTDVHPACAPWIIDKTFQNEEEFLAWKSEMQSSTHSQYIKSQTTKKQADELPAMDGDAVVRSEIFVCSRHGSLRRSVTQMAAAAAVPEEKKRSNRKGSKKLGISCPARVFALHLVNAAVRVQFLPLHSHSLAPSQQPGSTAGTAAAATGGDAPSTDDDEASNTHSVGTSEESGGGAASTAMQHALAYPGLPNLPLDGSSSSPTPTSGTSVVLPLIGAPAAATTTTTSTSASTSITPTVANTTSTTVSAHPQSLAQFHMIVQEHEHGPPDMPVPEVILGNTIKGTILSDLAEVRAAIEGRILNHADALNVQAVLKHAKQQILTLLSKPS